MTENEVRSPLQNTAQRLNFAVLGTIAMIASIVAGGSELPELGIVLVIIGVGFWIIFAMYDIFAQYIRASNYYK